MNAYSDTAAIEREAEPMPKAKPLMQATVLRDDLHAALQSVKRVAERRATIPVLTHVLLAARAGRLWLRTTDMDVQETVSVAATVAQGGRLTVPVHLLADIVKTSPKGGEIALCEAEGVPYKRCVGRDSDGKDVYRDALEPRLRVISGRSTSTLNGIDAGDFPRHVTSGRKPTHRFTMPAQELREMFAAVYFAISTEETRYYLNGVYLHAVAGVLRAVATDGHRMARVDRNAPAGADSLPGAIVPTICVNEALKLIGKSKDSVRVAIQPSFVEFRLGDTVLRSKLVDGTFPDYARVIPTGNDKRLVVDKAAFTAALKRVSSLSSERGRAVKLSIDGVNQGRGYDGRVVLSVNNPDAGAVNEEIGALQWWDGEPLDIGFNATHLLDIVAQCESEELTFKFSDYGSPTMITGEDTRFLAVQMPCRV